MCLTGRSLTTLVRTRALELVSEGKGGGSTEGSPGQSTLPKGTEALSPATLPIPPPQPLLAGSYHPSFTPACSRYLLGSVYLWLWITLQGKVLWKTVGPQGIYQALSSVRTGYAVTSCLGLPVPWFWFLLG